MADPELVAYIAKHAKLHGDSVVRTQLIRDGLPPSEIDQAFAEAQSSTMRKQKNKRKLALFAVAIGGLLLAMAAMLSREPETPAPEEAAPAEAVSSEPSTFHGHYGYMLRLPAGYKASGEFVDAEKRVERVYIYPAGTDSTHFLHEGLYGHLGILRLEVAPRRVPQGFIGIDTLRSFWKRSLTSQKAIFQMRDMIVHGMPGFVITEEKPFQRVKAHMVGEKVRFMLVGGSEDGLFTEVLSSLAEVSPHDRPGK
jgi:hypothetical protein